MSDDTDKATGARPVRRWSVIAAGVGVAALVAAAAVGALTDGDDPDELTDVALYAPDAPADLELFGALLGDDPDGPSGHTVVYGQNEALTGPVMVLTSAPAGRRFPVDADPEAHQEVVHVGEVDGLLTADPASGRLTLAWQPADDRQNVLVARGFDASIVNAAARSVTGDLDTVALDDPAGLGLHPIVEGPADDLVSGTFQPRQGGATVVYGDESRQLIVLTGGDDHAVPVAGVMYDQPRNLVVSGERAVSALIGPDPDDPVGAIVAWREDDGTVVRVVGLNLSRDEVIEAAQTVHPISDDEFVALQEQAAD